MARSELLWSVLCATLSSRQAKFLALMDVLLPQAEKDGRVEVVALHNDGERSIAEYRQALLEDARGDYISFVDDDDRVEDDFVSTITAAMEDFPDYIAFYHAYYCNGIREPRPVVTGIQYETWHDTADMLVRGVTHVNPVRTVIARHADFRRPSGKGEDVSYVEGVIPLLRTQAEVPKVLYHYLHVPGDSVQHGLAPHAYARRPVIDSPAFRWHPGSTG